MVQDYIFFFHDISMKLIVHKLFTIDNFKWSLFCYKTWYYFEKREVMSLGRLTNLQRLSLIC